MRSVRPIGSCALAVALAALVVSACGGGAQTSPPPETSGEAAGDSAGDSAREAETGKEAAPEGDKPAEPEVDHGPEPGAEPKAGEAKGGASDVPGANLTVGHIEADGLVAKDIACKTEGGAGMALLGVVLVTAWMGPQKKALDACAKAGTETRVVWKARGGKVTEIEAKGDAKTKACVERALSGGKPVLEGHCAATVVHGK